MIDKMVVTVALITAIAALSPLNALRAEPAALPDTASRLDSVQRLLSESSAARQVDDSGNPQALALKSEAQAHFDRAAELHADGDAAAAEAELREAIRLMTEAARAAHGESDVTQKQSDDYGQRRESVAALAKAHDRIATEKRLGEMNSGLQQRVRADLAASDALLAAGDAVGARAKLDATYEAIKSSLEELRGGDTLVRELKFESKEDEYRYELDRNDTHRMLVQVLFAEKMESSPMRATAVGFIDSAAALRADAEAAAAKKKFAAAIELLEKSTSELIRAMRSAGVYIPG